MNDKTATNKSKIDFVFEEKDNAARLRFANCPTGHLLLKRSVDPDPDLIGKFCIIIRTEHGDEYQNPSSVGVECNFRGIVQTNQKISDQFEDGKLLSRQLWLYEKQQDADELARVADCAEAVSFSVCRIDSEGNSIIVRELKEFCKQNLIKVEFLQNHLYIGKDEYDNHPGKDGMKRLCAE